jgi:hypothetical protein
MKPDLTLLVEGELLSQEEILISQGGTRLEKTASESDEIQFTSGIESRVSIRVLQGGPIPSNSTSHRTELLVGVNTSTS